MSSVLVIGAGVAGIACAIAAAERGVEVLLVTPGKFDPVTGAANALAGGNTALAQGGIAAAVGLGDTAELHAADTVMAGAGLVDKAAAAQLTRDGAASVHALIAGGFAADRDADGALALGLEAAHGKARIVHAGEDRTGAALHQYLSQRLHALRESGFIRLIEESTAVSLMSDAGTVTGALLRDGSGGLSAVRADAVVLATGGYGAMYPRSSNHEGARGEGIVLAARVGAVVADLEFVQFHPTVLAGTGTLISEAVRGAGAVLRDSSGARFMLGVHEAAELAPRDVVSRAIHRALRDSGESCVWLDATDVERSQGAGTLARRFPNLTAAIAGLGVDWATEPVPVAPAAHYTMGGVVTDLDGRTSVPGLFAAGEVASTGVHGANRLASNSLLEGLVFGARAADAAVRYTAGGAAGGGQWSLRGADALALVSGAEELPLPGPLGRAAEVVHSAGDAAGNAVGNAAGLAGIAGEQRADSAVRAAVSIGLGIERDAEELERTVHAVSGLDGSLAELARMAAIAALARAESRGSHQRTDYPETSSRLAARQAWKVAHARSGQRLPHIDNAVPHTPLEPRSASAC